MNHVAVPLTEVKSEYTFQCLMASTWVATR